MIEQPNELSLPVFVNQTLHANLDAIRCEISGVLDNADIEYIHRIRIAVRRLRNNLIIFSHFSYPALCKILSDLHQQTDFFAILLAQARDLDMQQVLIDSLLQNTLPQSAARLQAIVSEDRQRIQKGLEAQLSSGIFSRQLDEYQNTLQIINTSADDTSRFVEDMPNRAMVSTAAQTIAGLSRMHAHIDPVSRHQFRKTVRRLRYTMECFQSSIAFDLQESITYIHLIQDMLGDIHDLDILIQIVEEHRDAIRADYPAILPIIQNAQLPYLGDFIQACESGGFMQLLLSILQKFNPTTYNPDGNINHDHSAHW